MPGFRPVDTKQSFPELEERLLERWRERDVFHRSLANREGAEVWGVHYRRVSLMQKSQREIANVGFSSCECRQRCVYN